MAQGVPVVAMHRSTAWTTTDGLRIDTGMYLLGHGGDVRTARGPRSASRRREGFLASAARLGVDPDEMYMVGDDLNNDVLAAQVVGMTGVLVRTGKFRQDTLDRWAADEFAMQPNHVMDSVADLPELLGALGRLGRSSVASGGQLALHIADRGDAVLQLLAVRRGDRRTGVAPAQLVVNPAVRLAGAVVERRHQKR